MVRTKADGGARKAVAAKAPRKILGSSSGGASSSSSSPSQAKQGKYAGGNSACPRPTPEWQQGIGSFFTSPAKSSLAKEKENEEPIEDCEGPSSSSSSSQGAAQSSGSCAEEASGSSSSQDEAPARNNLIESDED